MHWENINYMEIIINKRDECGIINIQVKPNFHPTRLLAMHNGLMRRYERELKTGMQHVETITTLQVKYDYHVPRLIGFVQSAGCFSTQSLKYITQRQDVCTKVH